MRTNDVKSRGGNFKLTRRAVSKIKKDVLAGVSISSLSERHNVTYQAVYRIAKGETWCDVEPTGDLVERPKPKKMSSRHRDKIYAVKRRKGLTNADIAERQGFSESAIARAMRDARLALAFRVQRLLLTSGSHELAMSEFELSREDAEGLTSLAASSAVPRWLRRELEDGS